MTATPLTALIVDDEFHARENLAMMLAEFCPEVQVLDTAGSVSEARQKIDSLRPQVVFLDIRMPSGAEGFELLEQQPEKKFQVVFVTAFKDYAIRAFNANAIHYILKPIDIEELQAAVKKLVDYYHAFSDDKANLQHYLDSVKQLAESIKHSTRPHRITLYHSRGFKIVDESEIVRLEADGNCTRLFFKDGTQYLDSKTLKVFEEMLSSEKFMRVHKSHMINLSGVREYLSADGGTLVMQDGAHVPVSRMRMAELTGRLKW